MLTAVKGNMEIISIFLVKSTGTVHSARQSEVCGSSIVLLAFLSPMTAIFPSLEHSNLTNDFRIQKLSEKLFPLVNTPQPS
jgi:hypothetical protein